MYVKPIKLYWRNHVPNPSKVELDGLKQKPYTNVNPNGRVPAIYLIDTYDKDNKISYSTFPEKYLTQQWSFFQASGQGPYFGQAAWFNLFHEGAYGESPESAKVRYGNEVKRVAGVLDGVLAKSTWLVGDKCTYADLTFTMWNA
ncbi:hypothetical protein F4806DRAFT_500815 [Annulohypoxylon nitens]|nr:hypothetical protein F4806DRAFT_500815 [Annulohypoxylon nitens]